MGIMQTRFIYLTLCIGFVLLFLAVGVPGAAAEVSCQDADGDGYYVGCESYETIDGPDADDSDPNVWTIDGAANCGDADGDGYYSY
jgi:hypothetical protein